MSAELGFKGVGGVARVTMLGKSGKTYTEGMALTLTAANTVGVGLAAGSAMFGVVTKVESRDGDILLGVQTAGFSDEVKMTATAANRPAVGNPACCDDKGDLVKPPATVPAGVRGIVTAIDITANTATVVF